MFSPDLWRMLETTVKFIKFTDGLCVMEQEITSPDQIISTPQSSMNDYPLGADG